MIDPTSPVLSISAQCDLLSVNRSRYYYVPVGESQENLAIMRQLDEQYFLTPFYGALAQMVERQFEGLRVAGSLPASPTI